MRADSTSLGVEVVRKSSAPASRTATSSLAESASSQPETTTTRDISDSLMSWHTRATSKAPAEWPITTRSGETASNSSTIFRPTGTSLTS